MKRNNIKAVITEDWNRKRNYNCKFIAGDTVKVSIGNYTYKDGTTTYPSYYTKYDGMSGKVFAATCGPDGLLRSRKTTWYGRCYTKYYIEFENGDVYGFHSHHLKSI
jgi:hypothetical protein